MVANQMGWQQVGTKADSTLQTSQYFRFHPMGHSGASIMDGNNVPIGAIQRILGHENRKTTEIYLHSIGDLERNAITTFERAREKSHTDSHTVPEK